jgi:hypothetical protein
VLLEMVGVHEVSCQKEDSKTSYPYGHIMYRSILTLVWQIIKWECVNVLRMSGCWTYIVWCCRSMRLC